MSSRERPSGRPTYLQKSAEKQSTMQACGANRSQAEISCVTDWAQLRELKYPPFRSWRMTCRRSASGMMLGARSSQVNSSVTRRHWTRFPRLGARSRVRAAGSWMNPCNCSRAAWRISGYSRAIWRRSLCTSAYIWTARRLTLPLRAVRGLAHVGSIWPTVKPPTAHVSRLQHTARASTGRKGVPARPAASRAKAGGAYGLARAQCSAFTYSGSQPFRRPRADETIAGSSPAAGSVGGRAAARRTPSLKAPASR
mmetsp:Transcript_56565/g.159523  ORF Transcript_56565/g.159523 Transcript_56565/m.159523 type:complete len:254 (-) Transcript_56565:286-1047(-)